MVGTEFKLRELRLGDLWRVVFLADEAFRNRYQGPALVILRLGNPVALFFDFLKHTQNIVVAEHTKTRQVVGAIQVGRLRTQGTIQFIGVDPEFRRQGIATALHSAAHDRLKEMGFNKVRVHLRYENTPALRTVQKMGGVVEKGLVEMIYDI